MGPGNRVFSRKASSFSNAPSTACEDGCTYLWETVMLLCPATLMIVKASTPASPSLVSIVWRSEWITKSVCSPNLADDARTARGKNLQEERRNIVPARGRSLRNVRGTQRKSDFGFRRRFPLVPSLRPGCSRGASRDPNEENLPNDRNRGRGRGV